MQAMLNCSKCGSPIPPDARFGLCPRCLLGPRQRDGASGPLPSKEPAIATPPPLPPIGPKIHYIGDYEVLEEIGRGGMGVVYKARQISLNRLVAVKMTRSGELASEADIKRFDAEAKAVASLQHRNIVAIHEVGVHEGQHYYSMDYIEGSSLAEVTREHPLPPQRAARYVQLIAEAIHYAHQRGIVHLDLKPSNVLIDSADQPRVTDFGLARFIGKDSTLTLSGQIMGTPGYMSPEQAAGKRHEIGPLSDVYSLGTILYRLLTGRAPFVADTLEAALPQVLHNEPLSPRLLNPAVPRGLEIICLKCLAKQPKARYSSAAALAEDLKRWQSGEPILARPLWRLQRSWYWFWKRDAPMAFGYMLVFAGAQVIIIAALGLWGVQKAPMALVAVLFTFIVGFIFIVGGILSIKSVRGRLFHCCTKCGTVGCGTGVDLSYPSLFPIFLPFVGSFYLLYLTFSVWWRKRPFCCSHCGSVFYEANRAARIAVSAIYLAPMVLLVLYVITNLLSTHT